MPGASTTLPAIIDVGYGRYQTSLRRAAISDPQLGHHSLPYESRVLCPAAQRVPHPRLITHRIFSQSCERALPNGAICLPALADTLAFRSSNLVEPRHALEYGEESARNGDGRQCQGSSTLWIHTCRIMPDVPPRGSSIKPFSQYLCGDFHHGFAVIFLETYDSTFDIY